MRQHCGAKQVPRGRTFVDDVGVSRASGVDLARTAPAAVLLLCAAVVFLVAAARAQVVEENPAPLIFGDQRFGLEDEALDRSGDATPFGVTLRSLVIVNTDAEARPDPAWRRGDIDLSRAGARLQTQALLDSLQPFIGQPLSQKLLNELQADIVLHYRGIDRPFMAVTVPPQEITGGRLQLDIVEFAAGDVRAEGNLWTPHSHIGDRVRLETGGEIDASQLARDINWLNLNPYRNLGAVFEPGTVPGSTDIILRSDERRPWTVYGGYANSGSVSSGRDRVFAGVNIANLPVLDHQLSYQFTANPDSLADGDMVHVGRTPGYASHAMSYFAPLYFDNDLRSKLTATAGYVESGSEINAFFDDFSESWAVTTELAFPVDAGFADRFDAFVGVDVKRQDSRVEFGGAVVTRTVEGVGQLRGGVRADYGFDPLSFETDGTIELGGVYSPGGTVSESRDYAYAYGSLEQVSRLGRGFGLLLSATGQAAGSALPGLEQIALGGETSVRGYTTNEVSGDSGLQGSVQLLLPQVRTGLGDGLTLYANAYGFLDAGYVWDRTGPDNGLAGIGAGVDLAVDVYLTATLEFGVALDDAGNTARGDTTVYGTVVLRY